MHREKSLDYELMFFFTDRSFHFIHTFMVADKQKWITSTSVFVILIPMDARKKAMSILSFNSLAAENICEWIRFRLFDLFNKQWAQSLCDWFFFCLWQFEENKKKNKVNSCKSLKKLIQKRLNYCDELLFMPNVRKEKKCLVFIIEKFNPHKSVSCVKVKMFLFRFKRASATNETNRFGCCSCYCDYMSSYFCSSLIVLPHFLLVWMVDEHVYWQVRKTRRPKKTVTH